MLQGLVFCMALVGLSGAGVGGPCPGGPCLGGMDQPVGVCQGDGWMQVADLAFVLDDDDDDDLEKKIGDLTQHAMRLERELRKMRDILGDMLEDHGDEIASAVEDVVGEAVEEWVGRVKRDGGRNRLRLRRGDEGGDRLGGQIRRALRQWQKGFQGGPRAPQPKIQQRFWFSDGPAGCDACKLCKKHRGGAGRWVTAPKLHTFEIHPKVDGHGKVFMEKDGKRQVHVFKLDGSDHLHRVAREAREALENLHESMDVEVEHGEDGKLKIIIEHDGKRKVIDLDSHGMIDLDTESLGMDSVIRIEPAEVEIEVLLEEIRGIENPSSHNRHNFY